MLCTHCVLEAGCWGSESYTTLSAANTPCCAPTKHLPSTSRHQNIVDLIEVIIDGNPTPGRLSTVALVFEYLDHDLSGLLDTPEAANQITPALAKSYMMQLAAGVSRERSGIKCCWSCVSAFRVISGCGIFAFRRLLRVIDTGGDVCGDRHHVQQE